MKKFLLAYCFFLLQMTSCYFGEIEAVPESTRLSMINRSGFDLLSVRWNDIEFGDISESRSLEKEVSGGQDYIYFKANNDKLYRTNTRFRVEKYKQHRFTFIANTLVVDVANSTTPVILGSALNEN